MTLSEVRSAGGTPILGGWFRVSSVPSAACYSHTTRADTHHQQAGRFGDGGAVDSKSLYIEETKRADNRARRRNDVSQLIRISVRAEQGVRVGIGMEKANGKSARNRFRRFCLAAAAVLAATAITRRRKTRDFNSRIFRSNKGEVRKKNGRAICKTSPFSEQVVSSQGAVYPSGNCAPLSRTIRSQSSRVARATF